MQRKGVSELLAVYKVSQVVVYLILLKGKMKGILAVLGYTCNVSRYTCVLDMTPVGVACDAPMREFQDVRQRDSLGPNLSISFAFIPDQL